MTSPAPTSVPTTDGKPFAGTRLAFFYIATFGVIGIHMPYWPVWLKDHGLTAEEISTLIALAFGTKIFINPLFAHIADQRGERRWLILLMTAATLSGFFLFALADNFWTIFLVTALVAGSYSTIMPLIDSLTMLTAKVQKLDYGRIRLWGSLSFILAVSAFGRLLVDNSPDIIFYGVLTMSSMTVIAAWMLPDTRVEKPTDKRFTLFPLLQNKRFMVFILASALVQSSHAVYYTFGTLNWKAQGLSEDLIGILWATGVIAEIVLFAFAGRLIKYLSAMRLIALGGLAGLVRWAVIGFVGVDAVPLLFAMQILHAFTFGATHLGAIYFISGQVHPSLSASAQSLCGALVMGAGMGLSILVAGYLYGHYQAGAYFAMALIAALGGITAYVIARPRGQKH